MGIRNTAIALVCLTAVGTTAGCSLLKKAASGGKISSADVVNSADSKYKERERDQKQAADYVKRIDETLAAIEKQRKEGHFSSAEYREKTLQRYMDKLKELDADNPKLKSAPKRLAEIKQKYTKEVYARKALTDECQKDVDNAKEARMDERWRRVDYALVDYVKCRRKLKDAGGAADAIAAQDKLYEGEFQKFAAYALGIIEKDRKASQFRTAVAFEKNLEDKLDDYNEVAPDNDYTKGVAKRIKKVRMAYRDPREVEAEKAADAFKAWKKMAGETFAKEMKKLKDAEATAKPDYDAGVAALQKGDYKTALKKLTTARQKLYAAAYPSSVALDTAIANGDLKRGLSYKIAAAIARVQFEQGNLAKLYPELNIIKQGRPWLEDSEELKVHLYDILADRSGRLAPKASDPVKRYASRYSDTAKKWRFSKQAADAKVGQAYAMLGVDLSTVSHRQAGSNPGKYAGKVVYVSEPVTAVKGGSLQFDFRSAYKVPTKCWHTNKIASVNAYTGQVYYEQKCHYKKVKSGYILQVPRPRGVKIHKGDKVSFYATVGKKKGKYTVVLTDPGYVRIAPNGKTAWYLGVKVKK